jgi:uncharacterized coiled-coil protein SlyX
MSTEINIEKRLEELENQMAFQDELHSHLNDIVARQDREISELKHQVLSLSRRLKEVGESMPGEMGGQQDETPPHY